MVALHDNGSVVTNVDLWRGAPPNWVSNSEVFYAEPRWAVLGSGGSWKRNHTESEDSCPLGKQPVWLMSINEDQGMSRSQMTWNWGWSRKCTYFIQPHKLAARCNRSLCNVQKHDESSFHNIKRGFQLFRRRAWGGPRQIACTSHLFCFTRSTVQCGPS